MQGYSSRDVAKMLDLPIERVRAYARAGFIRPRKTTIGHYRFSFQELVVLRAARGLIAQNIPTRTIKRSLNRLRRQLPR